MRKRGTLSYELGKWTVKTTPDVTMRLKRIFPRMKQEVATELTVKHTGEIANDLEWILVRFPLEISAADHERLTCSAVAHREKLERLDQIMNSVPDGNEFNITYPLREYQAQAAKLYLAQGNLLIADEVGLGKTVCAIASLTDKRTMPMLVVVKTHLQKQWEAEIKRFVPGAWVHIIKQVKEYRLPIADVYVITYSKLSAWWGILAQIVKSVVYDEMQELRIPTSAKYIAARLLGQLIPFKLGLSATPVCNYGGEMWNIINLLAPDALGTQEEFNREWCSSRGDGKWWVNEPESLGHFLRDQKLMLRRTRVQVGRVLPPIVRYVQDVEFDRDVYEQGLSAADALARTILTGSFVDRGAAARQFDLELRQATGLAKATFVAELVRMLVDSGEKVLLGGWHRAVYEVWRDRLSDLMPAFFTGSESETQKERSRMDFIQGRTDVLIMSLRSGAGLNGLQDVCSVCVLGEYDWTPAVHEQFIGRLARDGQKASVQVFMPVAPIGSDPTMAAVLGLKQAQAIAIVDLGDTQRTEFTETDPTRLRQLAIDYLKSRKIPIPEPKNEAPA